MVNGHEATGRADAGAGGVGGSDDGAGKGGEGRARGAGKRTEAARVTGGGLLWKGGGPASTP